MRKKPVRCGCGGEAVHETSKGYNPFKEEFVEFWHRVICKECKVQTRAYYTEAEAIKAWNVAMGAKDINVPNKERTAKVKDLGHRWGAYGYCSNCGGYCVNEEPYCSHCGARLEWE